MVPSLKTMWPRLVVSGVLPLVGYTLLRPHVSSDAVGLTAVMVFPIVDIAVERRRHHTTDPIGVIAIIGIVVGIVGAVLFHGDALLLKIRESMLTGVFGLVCLGSLFRRRPVMWFMGRAFATGGDPEKTAEFDELWELPSVPRRFRFITAVWGIGLTLEFVVRLVLAFTVSTETFLATGPVIGWIVIGSLLLYTTRFSKRGEEQVLASLEVPVDQG